MTPRRLLVVAYYFPPTPSAGSVRMGGLFNYLPRFGWEVTVVTPSRAGRLPSDRVVETDDADLSSFVKGILGVPTDAALKDAAGPPVAPLGGRRPWKHRAIDLAKALLAYPDVHAPWIRIAARSARERLSRERFDAILTSSPPPSTHLVASRLRSASGLPWVADLRDLWWDDRNSTAPRFRRALDRRLERRTLRSASALVTVSEPLAEELRATHSRVPVHAILNGFDPARFQGESTPTRDFTLTHTGTFYQGRRDPTMLFHAVGNLLDSGRIPRGRLRIRLFAAREPWVGELADRMGLAEVVSVLPWTSWEEALRAQQESQALLLLHWGGEREVGVFTAKIFEYLGAKRPILAVGGPEGVITQLLDETGAGVHVRDLASLEAEILRLWSEYEAHGAARYHGDPARLSRYSQLRMAEEFAQVLDPLVRRD